jgi:hypothetical protein
MGLFFSSETDWKSKRETLMFTIKKIRLSELEDFVQSEMFQKFDVVPFTPARAKSYLQNPRAKPGDVVLYLGLIQNQLVAFRSLFADVAFVNNHPVRFAWCSGSWVRPAFRRNGYSLQLLTEAYTDWNKKLMFTNYAPESEKLYVKTGWFHPVHHFEGVRCYLFPKTRKLVKASDRNRLTKLIFSGIDFWIHLFSSLKVLFFNPKMNPDFHFEESSFPDEECFEWLQQYKTSFLFKREEAELKWIFENPWISDDNKPFQRKYPFSSVSKKFYYQTVKVFRKGSFAGWFVFSVREGHLKTLFFALEAGVEKNTAAYLKKYCVKYRLEMATIYNSKISTLLFQQKFPFLRLKKTGQKIYSTFAVPGEYQFQDGDGDVFFT